MLTTGLFISLVVSASLPVGAASGSGINIDQCAYVKCSITERCLKGKCVSQSGSEGGGGGPPDLPKPSPPKTPTSSPPKKTSSGSADTKAKCFPGHATVHTKNGKTKRMDELVVGDQILSVSEQRDSEDGSPLLEFVDVTYLPHLHNQKMVSFLEIECASATSGTTAVLSATKEHFVFVVTGGYDHDDDEELKSRDNKKNFAKIIQMAAFPAANIEVGDILWKKTTANNNQEKNAFELCKVSDIRSKVEEGMYSAFTTNGKMIVNDLLVSSYAGGFVKNVNHELAHQFCGGFHNWVYWLGISENPSFRWWNDNILKPIISAVA